MKRLYKSENNKVVAGVLGGLGEYFDIDPTMVRLAYLFVAILTAVIPAFLAYIVAMLIVPSRPRQQPPERV
jgi:phage shock protein C